MSVARTEGRRRGRIEQRGDTLRVIAYAGLDPVTDRRSYRRETIQGTDNAAYKRAQPAVTRLSAEIDKLPHSHILSQLQLTPSTSGCVPLQHARRLHGYMATWLTSRASHAPSLAPLSSTS